MVTSSPQNVTTTIPSRTSVIPLVTWEQGNQRYLSYATDPVVQIGVHVKST